MPKIAKANEVYVMFVHVQRKLDQTTSGENDFKDSGLVRELTG